MTQVSPTIRQPVEATARKAVSQRTKLELFMEQRGRCAKCDAKCALPDMDLDHRVALELGGADDRSNWQLICRQPCHSEKTRADRKVIAKVRRQRLKDRGEFPEPVRKLKSRGFRPGRNRMEEYSR